MGSFIRNVQTGFPKGQVPEAKINASANHDGENRLSARVSKMQRMINGTESSRKTNSIVESTKSYGESIRTQRNASKNTASSLKQLRYNFKNISSQLARSKTSVNAKQVASKARREVVKLKQKLMTGKYDKEELEAAITHAKSMERAANKKARHLLEEEMVKIDDDSVYDMTSSSLEEKYEQKIDEAYKNLDEEFEQSLSESSKEQIEDMEESIIESIEDVVEMISEDSEEMMDVLSDALRDMLEDTLGELADSLLMTTDTEMNEEEFKTFKIKHRNAEDKDILEADAKYLKAIFDRYSRMVSNSNLESPVAADSSQSAAMSGFEPAIINVVI